MSGDPGDPCRSNDVDAFKGGRTPWDLSQPVESPVRYARWTNLASAAGGNTGRRVCDTSGGIRFWMPRAACPPVRPLWWTHGAHTLAGKLPVAPALTVMHPCAPAGAHVVRHRWYAGACPTDWRIDATACRVYRFVPEASALTARNCRETSLTTGMRTQYAIHRDGGPDSSGTCRGRHRIIPDHPA